MRIALLCLLLTVSAAAAADWPCWRGPDRTGISKEAGLPDAWPEGFPPKAWSVPGLGAGYATVSIAKDRIYTTGMIGETGVLFCLDLSGKILWQSEYGPEWKGPQYAGARSTPAIHDGRIFLISAHGLAACFDLEGKKVWAVETLKEFDGKNITWGISESPLIDGNLAIFTPGGKDASVVALDAKTGKTVWTSKGLSDGSGYCSPMLIERGKKKIVLTMTDKAIVGLDAASGKVLWRHAHETKYGVNANTPLYADGWILVSSGYGYGSAGLELSADGLKLEPRWTAKKPDIHHGGAVLLGDRLIGAGNDKTWYALDRKTGEAKKTAPGNGKGSLVAAGGRIYAYNEEGRVALLDPETLEVKGSFQVTEGEAEHWAHPVVLDGRLYIRHGGTLLAYDLKK